MYKTYQEAKIDCPKACICRDKASGMFFATPSKGGTILSDTSEFAEAKDYCITVEEFLNAGHKFEICDAVLDYDDVINIDTDYLIIIYNDLDTQHDKNRYILRAAALEESNHTPSIHADSEFYKKPRTKVEYVKVEFEPNEIWKAFKEHQEVGYLYVNTSDGFECLFDGVFNLAMAISQGDQLYRRIETEIDERQEFIEECQKYGSWEEMYDSGKFKLVN